MSNLTSDFTINLINNISTEITRYMTLFIVLFGTIGNLLNIIVLSQPILRCNPCVLYFLSSSITSLGIILIGLPSRIIAGWISSDPTNTSSWFCKLRIFFLYSCRTISVWLLVFATIDRWFSSSKKFYRRRLSSNKIAYKCICIICSLSCIFWFELIICYDANVPQAPLKCYGKTVICRIFNDIVYASLTVTIPSLFMLIFGFLTIHNIKQTYRAIHPFVRILSNIDNISQVKRKRKIRRIERSLTRMLLLQVILLTFFSMPQAIHQFYLTFTVNINKSLLRITIENFIVNFNFLLTYMGNGSSFYIYTLYGTIFRQTVIRIIHLILRQFKFYVNFIFHWFIVFLFRIFFCQK